MSTQKTVTAPSHREPALDGLRGVAVTLVFFFHYGGGLTSHNPLLRLFGHLSAAGWIGVQIFFVLSGFLITSILWNNQTADYPHSLRNFYIRRFLRIVPLAWAAITISLIFCLALGNGVTIFRSFIPEYLFLQDMPRIMHDAEAAQKLPLFHLWTVSVEEQFYLLWPLLLLLCRRSLRAAQSLCLGVLLASLVYNAVFVLNPGLIAPEVQQRSIFTYCGALALGGLLALSFRRSPSSPTPPAINRFAAPALLFGFLGFLVAGLYQHSFLLLDTQYITALPCTWLASAALLVLLLRPGTAHQIFSNPALRFVGRYSYGFYVLHILLEPLFDHIGLAVAHQSAGYLYLATRLIAAFPITLALAWISYQLFEFPILKLKRYFPSAPAIPSA
jgi:peptidoglycan/LPS O-acetylase OafA/YrhL